MLEEFTPLKDLNCYTLVSPCQFYKCKKNDRSLDKLTIHISSNFKMLNLGDGVDVWYSVTMPQKITSIKISCLKKTTNYKNFMYTGLWVRVTLKRVKPYDDDDDDFRFLTLHT